MGNFRVSDMALCRQGCPPFTNGEKEYDKDGAMGARGKVNQTIVDKVLAAIFQTQHSEDNRSGRLLVIGWRKISAMGCLHVSERNSNGVRKLTLSGGAIPRDCATTTIRITVQSIAQAYKRCGLPSSADEVYMGGGGSYNPNIVGFLRD